MIADDNLALLSEMECEVSNLRWHLVRFRHTPELHAWLHTRLVGLRQALRECAELEA